MKMNTLAWAALLLLTLLSFSVSETSHAQTAATLILAAAGLKAALVGWQFMELRAAHPLWTATFLLLLAVTLGLVGLLV